MIGSSTNPTLPFGRDAVAEHYEMIVAVHGLNPTLPGDAAHRRATGSAPGRWAPRTCCTTSASSPSRRRDAQGMGRAGETVRRTFALAAVMKAEPRARRATAAHDNERVLRYLAKLTINPAIAHGLAHEVGSLEIGKLADIVLWRPDHFGAKPAARAEGRLSGLGRRPATRTRPSTRRSRSCSARSSAASARAAADLSVAFVSQAALDSGRRPAADPAAARAGPRHARPHPRRHGPPPAQRRRPGGPRRLGPTRGGTGLVALLPTRSRCPASTSSHVPPSRPTRP